MDRKIIQWVPIDGTRWRNEFVNDHETHGVGVHYGVAPGGVKAPLRELPTTGGLCGSWGRPCGGPSVILETHYDVDNRFNPARAESLVKL
jgi:hypothetical protein